MMIKKKIQKDLNKRKLFKKLEEKRILLKYLTYNLNYNLNKRLKIQMKLNKMPKKSSIIQINKKCILTGRSKSIYNYFKLSRIMINKLTTQKLLPGIRLNNW